MEIALDTNAYSDWLRSGVWDDKISQASRVIIPMIVIGELFYGFHGGDRFQKNKGILLDFLSEDAVEAVAPDLEISDCFGVFMNYLRRRGTKMPTNDVWIAATAHVRGATLLSDDVHFDFLPQLKRVSSDQ
jgi:tRNA(fMet)-specific endonuclease VapC